MNNLSFVQVWHQKLKYIFFCLLYIFISLIPISLTPSIIPPPDFILCLTSAFIIRGAIYTPFWIVAIIFLLADIFLSRPLGLSAFTALIYIEILRSKRFFFRDMSFLIEWMLVSIGFALLVLFQDIILILSFTKNLSISSHIFQLFITILCYPIVVFFVSSILRLKKFSLGSFNKLGHRL